MDILSNPRLKMKMFPFADWGPIIHSPVLDKKVCFFAGSAQREKKIKKYFVTLLEKQNSRSMSIPIKIPVEMIMRLDRVAEGLSISRPAVIKLSLKQWLDFKDPDGFEWQPTTRPRKKRKKAAAAKK